MLESQHKTLTDKFSSLTEKLSSIRVECANVKVDLNELTVLFQRLKDNVGKSLSGVSTKAHKNYENKFDAAKLKIQGALVDWWKKMTHFQIENARLGVSAGDELLRQSTDVQSSLEKCSALFSSRFAKASDVERSASKSLSVDTKKTRNLREASGLKGAKKHAGCLSSGNDVIDVDLLQADVLWVSFEK